MLNEKELIHRPRAFSRRKFIGAMSCFTAAVGAVPLPVVTAEKDKKPPCPSPTMFRYPYYSARSDLEATIACARMILGHYEPEEHFPIADVHEMTYHREGCWAFEAQLLPILLQKGYHPKLYATTPYKDLAEGRSTGRYGPEAGKHIHVEAIQWALPFLNKDTLKNPGVALDQALQWFCKGEMIMLNLSRSMLRESPDLPYCRYNVVITGISGDYLHFHDPSTGPHRKERRELVQGAFEADGTDRAVLRVAGPVKK